MVRRLTTRLPASNLRLYSATTSQFPPSHTPVSASSSSSSSSRNLLKTVHRRRVQELIMPVSPLVAESAEEAVDNILYNTASNSTTTPSNSLSSSNVAKRHILNCLVSNEPGVLSRISGILAARGKGTPQAQYSLNSHLYFISSMNDITPHHIHEIHRIQYRFARRLKD